MWFWHSRLEVGQEGPRTSTSIMGHRRKVQHGVGVWLHVDLWPDVHCHTRLWRRHLMRISRKPLAKEVRVVQLTSLMLVDG
jgi:hypothetical protein